MSSQKVKGKRALPNVPFNRASSLSAINVETPKSTKPRPIKPFKGSTAVLSSASPDLVGRKNSLPTSKTRTNSPQSARRSAVSNQTTPLRNTQTTIQRLQRATTDERLVGEDMNRYSLKSLTEDLDSSQEKKVARVLPMAPSLDIQHGESSQPQNRSRETLDKTASNLKTHCNELSKNIDSLSSTQDLPRSQTPQKNPPKNVIGPSTPAQEMEDSCIKVAVRVRPFLQRELDNPKIKSCVRMKGNQTFITSEAGVEYDFVYDHSLWSVNANHSNYVDQEDLYKLMAEPLVTSAFEGYNTCIFAYGQTGSGKSYSIMGEGDNPGVLPRFCEDLFQRIDVWSELQFTVEISYFEIYNEKIHDLLVSSSKDSKKQLRVREHPVIGPFVQDLSTYVVSSYADIKSWLAVGNRNRATAATGMNDKSSRSHSVFTVVMTQTKSEVFEDTETQLTKTSKMNLIDLAGSERACNVLNDQIVGSPEVQSLRLKEGGSINKSLHTLGKVISLLSDREQHQKKKFYIPYRDSVLTWLLKDSLGGNSKTSMIAAVSPANIHFGETLSTLRYAQRARTIVNKAVINEDPNAKIIKELRAEIERLKTFGGSSSSEVAQAALNEVVVLKEKLVQTQNLLADSTRKWQERLALSEKRKVQEAENLRKAGISFKVDNRLPNLVNLNEDPQLSEMLLYILKEGVTTVGHHRVCEDPQDVHDIQLTGALVADSHCSIKNEGENVIISPIDDAPTYVNGQHIIEETVLHHGDRIVIGGDHFFRFNHPIEVKKRRRELLTNGTTTEGAVADSGTVKDFEFARNELAVAQNARLQAELEEARQEAREEVRIKAQEEIMKEIQKQKEQAENKLNSQKAEYETRLVELQSSLKEVNVQKAEAEKSSQSAEEKISELQAHRMLLEQEILNNRKKLQMEALAAKQALEETKLNQVRIISELEKEKKKMQDDVLKLKEAKKQREKMKEQFQASFNNISKDENKKELLKITMSLREANKIAQSLSKHISFSRDNISVNDKCETRIRLNDTKRGMTTMWTLEKFESRLVQMRELYQLQENDDGSDSVSTDEDPFNDPEDKWEKDFKLDSPASRKMSTGGLSSLTSRSKREPLSARKQDFSKAENIFAKYRTKCGVDGPESTSDGAVGGSTNVEGHTPSSNLEKGRKTSKSGHELSSLFSAVCSQVLCETAASIDDRGSSSLCERILHTAHKLKTAVAGMYNSEYREKDRAITILQSFVAMEMILELSKLWVAKYKDKANGSELLESIGNTASFLQKMFLEMEENNSTEETIGATQEHIKNIVIQVAKFAMSSEDGDVLMHEVSLDEELNQAFCDGCNASWDMSIRESVCSMDEIQEEIESRTMASYSNKVEKEVAEDVLKLLKVTSDFLHQGQDIQRQIMLLKPRMTGVIKGSRRSYTKTFVHRIGVILNTAREMARGTTEACENMDITKLLDFSEDLLNAANAAVKETQSFIDSEFASLRGAVKSDINVEKEYFQQKYESVEAAATDLKQTIEKFLFSTPEESSLFVNGSGKHSSKCSRIGTGVTSEQSCVLHDAESDFSNSSYVGLDSCNGRTNDGGVQT